MIGYMTVGTKDLKKSGRRHFPIAGVRAYCVRR